MSQDQDPDSDTNEWLGSSAWIRVQVELGTAESVLMVIQPVG